MTVQVREPVLAMASCSRHLYEICSQSVIRLSIYMSSTPKNDNSEHIEAQEHEQTGTQAQESQSIAEQQSSMEAATSSATATATSSATATATISVAFVVAISFFATGLVAELVAVAVGEGPKRRYSVPSDVSEGADLAFKLYEQEGYVPTKLYKRNDNGKRFLRLQHKEDAKHRYDFYIGQMASEQAVKYLKSVYAQHSGGQVPAEIQAPKGASGRAGQAKQLSTSRTPRHRE